MKCENQPRDCHVHIEKISVINFYHTVTEGAFVIYIRNVSINNRGYWIITTQNDMEGSVVGYSVVCNLHHHHHGHIEFLMFDSCHFLVNRLRILFIYFSYKCCDDKCKTNSARAISVKQNLT